MRAALAAILVSFYLHQGSILLDKRACLNGMALQNDATCSVIGLIFDFFATTAIY